MELLSTNRQQRVNVKYTEQSIQKLNTLHLTYNPAGRSHCRLQNHHGYIKHHHRGIGGSPGDIGEVPMI